MVVYAAFRRFLLNIYETMGSILREGVYYWFWIGKHTEYNQFLKGK